MKKKWYICLPKILAMPLSFLALVFSISQISAQDCPELLSPLNGSVLAPLNSTISWESITGVPGYIISLGTTEGGVDILNQRNVGSANSYKPATGLPENTEIFVTITLFFFNQPNIVCDSKSFTTATLSEAPSCTTLNLPQENAIDVNIATTINWSASPGATSYFLSVGTSLNGAEIIDNFEVGNVLRYKPTVDLPEETTIYITVIPSNRIGLSVGCSSSQFTTAPMAELPFCTTMISPYNGETNIPLSPILEWNPVPNATGYRVTIGTSPFESNILENAIFSRTSTVVLDFEPNRTFFITIIPFNDAGDAIGCIQETFSTLLGCGPYFNPLTGELQVLNPELTFPDIVSICTDKSSNNITATDEADGYRWYKLDSNGNQTLMSSSKEVSITESGEYIYEAYSLFEDTGRTFECSSSKIFTVISSQAPVIENVKISNNGTTLNYEIFTVDTGNYEYALDDENGNYQNSNRFNEISFENHIVFVRDKSGCGITEKLIEQDLTVQGFPNFFTPNGDGINDFWQLKNEINPSELNIEFIYIFDRYGNFIVQINPKSKGWNGNFNGRQLPATDYWFRAISFSQKEIKGHFNLKR